MLNCFKLLDLPEVFNLSQDEIENKYLQLQLKYHPDKAKSDKEKTQYLHMSISINKAYEILKQASVRAEHILSLQGIDLTDPKFRSLVDIDFLEDIFKLQSKLDNVNSAVELRKLQQSLIKSYDSTIQDLTLLFKLKNYEKAKIKVMELKYWDNLVNMVNRKAKKCV